MKTLTPEDLAEQVAFKEFIINYQWERYCATRGKAALQQWITEMWRYEQPVEQRKPKWSLKYFFALLNAIEAADDDAKVMQILQEFDFDNQSDTTKAKALSIPLLRKIKDAPLFQTILTLDRVNCFKTLIKCIPLSIVDLNFNETHINEFEWADDSDITWYILHKGKAVWNLDHNIDAGSIEGQEDKMEISTPEELVEQVPIEELTDKETDDEKLRITQKMASIALAAELLVYACQLNAIECSKFLLKKAPGLLFIPEKQQALKAASLDHREVKDLLNEHIMNTLANTRVGLGCLSKNDETVNEETECYNISADKTRHKVKQDHRR